MAAVKGFKTNNTQQPTKNAVKDKVNIIFRFEYPNIFSESKSVLDLINIKYQTAEIKIINGNNSIIKFGINKNVR
tara:strand:+ start:879 stop:1103 length:225 start_codon:yes stop_codon:yes gene_type:complete